MEKEELEMLIGYWFDKYSMDEHLTVDAKPIAIADLIKLFELWQKANPPKP